MVLPNAYRRRDACDRVRSGSGDGPGHQRRSDLLARLDDRRRSGRYRRHLLISLPAVGRRERSYGVLCLPSPARRCHRRARFDHRRSRWGFIIGLAEVYTGAYLDFSFLGTGFAGIMPYIVMMAVLLVQALRPLRNRGGAAGMRGRPLLYTKYASEMALVPTWTKADLPGAVPRPAHTDSPSGHPRSGVPRGLRLDAHPERGADLRRWRAWTAHPLRPHRPGVARSCVLHGSRCVYGCRTRRRGGQGNDRLGSSDVDLAASCWHCCCAHRRTGGADGRACARHLPCDCHCRPGVHR